MTTTTTTTATTTTKENYDVNELAAYDSDEDTIVNEQAANNKPQAMSETKKYVPQIPCSNAIFLFSIL